MDDDQSDSAKSGRQLLAYPQRSSMDIVNQENKRQLQVAKVFNETTRIRRFELVDPGGNSLTPFEAGAHIHVQINDGLTRQYSLCNDPCETHRYVISVLDEPDGRGGSHFLYAKLKEGDLLTIAGPDNHFPLATRGVKHQLLLAAGIGVTPMVAMVHALEKREASYTLHYCTRDETSTAFYELLKSVAHSGEVIFHHGEGDPTKRLDIAQTIGNYKVGTHVYACGPSGFMSAFNEAVKNWPPHVTHQEYFAARELSEEEKAWDAKPFEVILKNSHKVIPVAAGQSISDALKDNGVSINTDCAEGYCGTCITRYTDGEPVHRDSVLDDADRDQYVMVCCARSKTDRLELDL